MDEFFPSIAVEVSPNPTPAEVMIITLGKRSGCFQVSLGNGEGIAIMKFASYILNWCCNVVFSAF